MTHEGNGLLVDPPAADALADALARLIVDFSLRRRLIAAGYATARAHTLEVQAERMMKDVSAHLGVETCLPVSASYSRR
jgi:glycosyltransferase involved in cell wall biosynthesis